MITFASRAAQMGLSVNVDKGLYHYKDKLSEVLYRDLITIPQHPEEPVHKPHPTDGFPSGYVGVFTKLPDEEQWNYQGIVSRIYRFIGNEVLNDLIRASIEETNMPVVRENILVSEQLTQMRNEIVLSNPVDTEVGDILPIIMVRNSYNGTWAQGMQFGITSDKHEFLFAFDMGQIRQIHVAGATTTVASEIGEYTRIFKESISDVIKQSFATTFTEDQLLGVLDLIETFGKRKRAAISEIIEQITPEGQRLPSAWHMFLAIVKFSSLEGNLNAKRLLESAAESVLVVPMQMREALAKLQRGEY